MSKKILIVGEAKTGTTGLYYKILNSMPPGVMCGFEPDRHTKNDGKPCNELVKVLFRDEIVRFDTKYFDKVVLIVRDPRDRLISLVMYWVLGNEIYGNDSLLRDYLAVLRKKELDPKSVSLVTIIRQVAKSTWRYFCLESYLNTMRTMMDKYIKWMRSQDNAFVLRYEDFVRGDLAALSEYLEMDLSGEADVDDSVSQVVRTKGYGDWKNWFLPEDVDVFIDVFNSYIHAFGYDPSWALPELQVVKPEYCTEYTIRASNKYRMSQASVTGTDIALFDRDAWFAEVANLPVGSLGMIADNGDQNAGQQACIRQLYSQSRTYYNSLKDIEAKFQAAQSSLEKIRLEYADLQKYASGLVLSIENYENELARRAAVIETLRASADTGNN